MSGVIVDMESQLIEKFFMGFRIAENHFGVLRQAVESGSHNAMIKAVDIGLKNSGELGVYLHWLKHFLHKCYGSPRALPAFARTPVKVDRLEPSFITDARSLAQGAGQKFWKCLTGNGVWVRPLAVRTNLAWFLPTRAA
ncbi:hypothetical protein BOSE62_30243 [Bosea sp. 62]|nr:hypothetical protein BOSE46_130290 [Bosea sp. 46]CAD5267854.1 hypothetical protein BOSE21B_111382 [Bosea sp. 21B]CAD5271104.1 hypothetical protein BOSE7B_30014 [Bosea sp. 7B]VVT55554.1 hypothetical protein BOS5A_120014 [Bosea sp. EC-HK365B]VXB88432.1 hypothetical protein BOSE29B_130220 [Bosea sp. 29B]VXC15220.1 hypothetical protein BOSE62_30243 [Bosea sp. 62]VXC26883.1 hypothetical protein BOSE125_180345 [Bosea sp. 125]VXC67250.1 hypothetical protein BOSE127_40014 [Bosea sp. 127]